jgi:hypothetical protein
MPGELLHARPVNSAGLVERDRKRLGGGLDMLGGLVPLQRAPLEDGGFLRALRLGVVVFKGEEEGLIGVAGKGPEILAGGEGAIPRDKGIVDAVESFRASMMRSSGASSSWVLNTSRTASRTAIIPLMRAAADPERLAARSCCRCG